MRREGRLSGNLWNRQLHEMVKVHGKPTNASKFSGKCGSTRCGCYPISKSKAKAKGRNKRSLPLDDEWVIRPLLSGSNRIMNTGLVDIDYENYTPDVWHADRSGAVKVVYDMTHYAAEGSPFSDKGDDVNVSAASLLVDAWHTDRHSIKDDTQSHVSFDKGNDGDTMLADALCDLMRASSINPTYVRYAEWCDAKDVYNYAAQQARAFSYDGVNAVTACPLMHLANVQVLEQMFVATDDVTCAHDDGASDWDHKMFVDMVDDVVIDKDDDNFKDRDYVDIPNESSWGCLTEETVSDIESEQSSIGDDWCNVTPTEIIDDWYLC